MAPFFENLEFEFFSKLISAGEGGMFKIACGDREIER